MAGDVILALDLGTVLGFATGKAGCRQPTHGQFRLPGERSDAGFFEAYMSFIADRITLFDPDILAFEAPILTAAKTGFGTAYRLIGLAAITEAIAKRREVRVIERAANASIKKHAAGSGRAEKQDVIDAIRSKWGWDPKGSNDADALGLFLLTEARHFPKIQRASGPLFADARA